MRAQVNSLLIVGLLQLLVQQQQRIKFLAQAEWRGICGNDLFVTKDSELFRKPAVKRLQIMKSRQDYRRATDRLGRDPVVVRLSIVYDPTFAEAYADEQGIAVYVRNLIYNAQLIYEQPEMSSKIRWEFVVVSIKAATFNYGPHLNAIDKLNSFHNSSDFHSSTESDISILLVFHNLWADEPKAIGSGITQIKILGLAYQGSFCNHVKGFLKPSALAMTGNTVGGGGQTLAHELAHAFGAGHDGVGHPTSVEGKCSPESYIMSPSSGSEKINWSPCTVEAILNNLAPSLDCVYDPKRTANANPISDYFNFKPTNGNQNRLLLPGKNISLDLQCQSSIDKLARSALLLHNRNGNSAYETCQEHICSIGNLLEVSIGPAPAGSRCLAKETQKQGECRNGKCSAE